MNRIRFVWTDIDGTPRADTQQEWPWVPRVGEFVSFDSKDFDSEVYRVTAVTYSRSKVTRSTSGPSAVGYSYTDTLPIVALVLTPKQA